MKTTSVLLVSVISFILLSAATISKKGKVIQINIDHLLNARSVTTFTNGKLVTWSRGIDGNGTADGYLSLSAALFKGDKNPHALPDNPLIPATAQHPEVLLHYNNNDSLSNQTLAVSGKGSFGFEVPPSRYSELFLALTSSEGASQIKVDLHYTDGIESKSFEVPDYYLDIQANDQDYCYLIHDLAKWGKTNNMTEKDHHNIDLLNIHPDPKRTLSHIKVEKTQTGYLVFWASVGLAVN